MNIDKYKKIRIICKGDGILTCRKVQNCFDICLETQINPNGGVEIKVNCDNNCSAAHGVLRFVACFDTTVNDDLSFSAELVSLTTRPIQ
jgi:hypothetical protein